MNVGEVLDCVCEGVVRRRVRSYKMNVESSRSYVVFIVYVECYFGVLCVNGGGDCDDDVGVFCDDFGDVEIMCGKMIFVDLVGSECLKYSGSEDVGSRETSLINKSFFVFGKVILIFVDEL